MAEGVNFPNLSPAIGGFGVQLAFHDTCNIKSIFDITYIVCNFKPIRDFGWL